MIRAFLFSVLGTMCFSASAMAQDFDDVVDVDILPGWRTASGHHMAAVKMTLKDGWKTYWRSPGDVGIPPKFDWRGSDNLANVDMIWPTPTVTVDYGLRTIGYKNELILPMRLTPVKGQGDVSLNGVISIGVCREICIQFRDDVTAELSRDITKPDPRIAAALANRPFSPKEAGVSRVDCEIRPEEEGIGLTAKIGMPSAGGRETAIVEVMNNPDIWVAQSETRREGGQLVARTQLQHIEGRSFALDRSSIRITVLGQSHAVDIQGCALG